MKPYSVYDAEFKTYGQVQHGFPTEELLAVLANTPVADGVEYMYCALALQGAAGSAGLVNGHN